MFRHLMRRPLPWTFPTGRRPSGRPRTCWKGFYRQERKIDDIWMQTIGCKNVQEVQKPHAGNCFYNNNNNKLWLKSFCKNVPEAQSTIIHDILLFCFLKWAVFSLHPIQQWHPPPTINPLVQSVPPLCLRCLRGRRLPPRCSRPWLALTTTAPHTEAIAPLTGRQRLSQRRTPRATAPDQSPPHKWR